MKLIINLNEEKSTAEIYEDDELKIELDVDASNFKDDMSAITYIVYRLYERKLETEKHDKN